MQRTRAEEYVRRAFGIPEGEPLPETPLRQFLRARLGRVPRHADLFAMLAQMREDIGFGGVTVEIAEGFLTLQDVVGYVASMTDLPVTKQ